MLKSRSERLQIPTARKGAAGSGPAVRWASMRLVGSVLPAPLGLPGPRSWRTRPTARPTGTRGLPAPSPSSTSSIPSSMTFSSHASTSSRRPVSLHHGLVFREDEGCGLWWFTPGCPTTRTPPRPTWPSTWPPRQSRRTACPCPWLDRALPRARGEARGVVADYILLLGDRGGSPRRGMAAQGRITTTVASAGIRRRRLRRRCGHGGGDTQGR